MPNKMNDRTFLAHAAVNPSEHHGFINPAIYRGSTVAFPNVAALAGGKQPYRYGR
ncbi:hypothetical protein [Gluconobacter cerevisiae]|uniref:hypothetical protein n=2 Tax=Gluconobacter cerevisiae TaxID=1379734 RepID=UPI002ADD724D|nr:hypothetical protein [Gluconobacter cerevisiae]